MPHNTDMPTRYIADMELGHWVTGSMGHLSRPGHRVIILTQSETRVFSFFKKTQNAKRTFVKIRPTVIENDI